MVVHAGIEGIQSVAKFKNLSKFLQNYYKELV